MDWTSDYFLDIIENNSNDIDNICDLKKSYHKNDKLLFITQEDMKNYNNYNNLHEHNIMIDYELENLHMDAQIKLGDNLLYYKNDSNCWCCNNYIIIHHSNIDNFIKKYIKDDNTDNKNNFNLKNKPSSMLIKILYRLHPEYFDVYDITKIKYLNNLTKSYLSEDSYSYIYDNYFKSSNNNFTCSECFTCTICKNNLCDKHMIFNPCITSKCKYCNKFWNICIWCRNDKLINFFDNDLNKICYEKSLCKIYHHNI